MKDREAFDRIERVAHQAAPGADAAIALELSCPRCGRSQPRAGSACEGCGTPLPQLPDAWRLVVPDDAAAVRVRWARAGERVPAPPAAGDPLLLIHEPRGVVSRLRARLGLWPSDGRDAVGRRFALGSTHVSVVAPPAAGPTLLETLPDRVAAAAARPRGSLRIERTIVSAGRSVSCFFGEGSSNGFVAKIPLAARSLARCAEGHAVLAEIHALVAPRPELTRVLPRPVATLTVSRHTVFVETIVPGTPQVRRSPGVRSRRQEAATFLGALHAATRQEVCFERSLFEDRIGHYCDRLEAHVSGGSAATVRRLKDSLRAGLEGRGLPLVVEHGDFHLGNCLFEGSRLTGVVDWDLGASRGLPVLDLLHLLVTSEGRLDGGTARRLFGGLSGDSQRLAAEYLSVVGVPRETLGSWTLVYVLVKLLAPLLVREGESRERWRIEVAEPTLAAL